MRQIKSMNLPVPTKEPLSIRVTFFENATDVLTDDVGIEFADVTPPQSRRNKRDDYVWDHRTTFPHIVLMDSATMVVEVVKASEGKRGGKPVVR